MMSWREVCLLHLEYNEDGSAYDLTNCIYVLGHLLPPKQLSFNLLRILCLFLSRRDAAAPQPEEQPAISHSH